MTALCLFSLAIASFSFGGGDDLKMAAAVHRSSGTAGCVLVGFQRKWPKVEFKYANPTELKLVLKRRFEMTFGEGPLSNEAWSSGAYPAEFFYKQRSIDLDSQLPLANLEHLGPTWPRPFDSESKVKYLAMDQIQALSTSKKLEFHWVFDKARLAINGKIGSETQLITLVARAMGGELKETKTEIYIDFHL